MVAISICRCFRNNKIYGGMNKPFIHAHLIVTDTLQFVVHLVHLGIASSMFGRDSLAMIGTTPRGPSVRRLRRCDWLPPATDRHAIHIAGIPSPKGAFVGGILRDHRGSFIGAVAGPSGLAFGQAVDVHALLRGVDLAGQSRCLTVDVWTDSCSLVDNISLPTPLWDCERSRATIRDFYRQHGLGLHHTRRRGCAIAIAMAEWGLSLDHLTFIFLVITLPSAVRCSIVRDARAFVDPGC